MKWMHRLNTVFYRLIISYTILIMIVIGTVGTGSYIYFSSSLNEQIEKVNQSSLHQMSDSIIQHVVELSEKTYVRLIMEQKEINDVLRLFDNTYENDYNRIALVHAKLINERQNQLDVIDSIEIYYNDNQLGISTRTGVTYYLEPHSLQPDWLEQMEGINAGTAWMLTKDSEGSVSVMFVRAYPYAQPEEFIKGYVAITIKSEAIRKLVNSSALPESGSLLLLDAAMQPIIANGAPVMDQRATALSDILSGSKPEGNALMDSEAGSSIVSFTTVPGTGWKMISITPVHEFYKKSIALRNTLILLCFAAILVGVVISHIFTWNLYNPIKRLSQAASVLLGHTPAATNKSINEISYINYAINNLSVKVSKLESTLQTNQPLIKHHIVQSLLYGSYPGGNELEERMSLLHLQWSHARYCCVRLRFDSAQFMKVDVQSKHFIKYNLLDELESFRTEKLLVLAIEISETDICCIFGHSAKEPAPVHSVMESISSYCHSNFLLRPSVAVGAYVEELRYLGDSFRETESIIKYAYFRPEAVLAGRRFLDREASQAPLPLNIAADFDRGLQGGDITAIREVLERLKTLCQDGPYSADQCHEGWKQLVICFYRNMKELGIHSEDVVHPELQEQLRTASHMIRFEEWFIQSVDSFFQLQELKLESRKYEMVGKARHYIEEHLQDPLSLELVAEHVHVTARYLSKLFKEESGSTFTEYVTHIRLNKAKDLIETTSYSVEQISSLAGFSSSAYFIRKFKEAFGSTPKVYKSRLE